MAIFYHGTATTFEASILKHGLRKTRGKHWNAIAMTLEGEPIAPFQFPGDVWATEHLYLAGEYARAKALLLRTKKGKTVIFTQMKFDGELLFSRIKMIKTGPVCDPLARPIVFAMEIPDDEPRLPACPLTCRLLRTISPEMLSVIR